MDLFQYLNDIQEHDLKKIREANFGAESILPNRFFSNPLIHIKNETDDFLMIEEYLLLGNRTEDPINYSSFLSIISHFIENIIPEDSHGDNILYIMKTLISSLTILNQKSNWNIMGKTI